MERTHKKQFTGYVDHGLGMENDDDTEEASHVLVFMVVPVNARGKLPLAYYFTKRRKPKLSKTFAWY